jgi:drug/metabolite transporter (DMT)-like permease
MNWLLLTILAVSSRGIFSIAAKLFSSTTKTSPMTQGVVLTLCATIFTFLISPFIGGISFNGIISVWPIAVIMVLSQAFGNVLFFKGLEKLDAGTTQIAFSSILIWGILLSSLFLKSNFTLEQIAGALIVMIAIIFSAYRKSHKSLGSNILYIVASAFIFSIFQVTSAQLALTISTGAYLIMAYLGSTIIIGAVYWKKVFPEIKKLKENTLPVLSATIFAGITSLGYFVFSYFAYAAAPSRGVVVLLLATQVILSVILGIIFLKEKEHAGRKLISAVVAVIGAILINS